MKTRVTITNEHGFTLLEVMIALVIFSVGLIGLAGLQSASVLDNSRSYYRIQANFLAYDILDRMRANRDQALLGNYNIGIGPVPTDPLCNGTSATCSPTAMAYSDRREWKQALATNLPAGNGSISRSLAAIDQPFVISVQWDDNRSGTPQSITITGTL